VKSIPYIFVFFGDQKYSDSVSRIWLVYEESRNITNSKLHWTVLFYCTLREAKRKNS